MRRLLIALGVLAGLAIALTVWVTRGDGFTPEPESGYLRDLREAGLI